ncbi:MAG: glycerophosphodiester phosphodiesterase [Nitrospirota bacterium]
MPFACQAPHHPFFGQSLVRPLVISHRGGAGLWPENTLYGFQRAAAMGVDVLETDMHSTADGVLVLIHDPTVDRTTNGSGRVNHLTLSQLKALDAGYHWSEDGGSSFPFRGRGITVPTVDEVFSAFPEMRINIDIKQVRPSVAERFCRLILDFGMVERVMVASFNSSALREFRRLCPAVATSAGRSEVRLFYALSLLSPRAAFLPAGCYALQVPVSRKGLRVITKRFLVWARLRNLQVHAWTVNSGPQMEWLLRLGVDGIVTDYPDRLLALLGRLPGLHYQRS